MQRKNGARDRESLVRPTVDRPDSDSVVIVALVSPRPLVHSAPWLHWSKSIEDLKPIDTWGSDYSRIRKPQVAGRKQSTQHFQQPPLEEFSIDIDLLGRCDAVTFDGC
jgi:hypothetical protein